MFLAGLSTRQCKELASAFVAVVANCAFFASGASADPPTFVATAQLDLGGDLSTTSGQYGGLAGTGQIPGGESHAFVLDNGQMTDLGTFGGTRSGAGFINNAGDVVGSASLANGVTHPFLYQNGTMTDLLANLAGSKNYDGGASGLNSAGQILLDYFPLVSSGLPYFVHAAIWQNNQITDLGTLGGNRTFASAINPSGEVTGYSYTASNVTQAFVYSNGTMTSLAGVPGVLASAQYSDSEGVSDSGVVAGTYSGGTGSSMRSYIYANGQTTDIGTLGGSSTDVYSVAANGDVLGESQTASGVEHAFVYRNGVMTDLGTLDGPNANSNADKENTAGQIIGNSDTGVAGQSHAFVTSGTALTDLGTLGGKFSGPAGINSSGTIVGSSLLADNSTSHAFVYQGGVMSDLGTLGGIASSAAAINDSGEIVGTSTTAGGQYRAFTFVNGQVVAIPTLGGAISQADAANAAGQVVGYSQTVAGNNHAFVYQAGVVTDLNNILGGQSSTAIAINSSGQIAGTYQPAGADTSHEHAFLDSNGTVTDLNVPANPSSQATAINSRGDVVGEFKTSYGSTDAFLYANGHVTNLDTYDGSSTAVAVNDNDQVLINSPVGVRLYSAGTLEMFAPPEFKQRGRGHEQSWRCGRELRWRFLPRVPV